MEHNRQFVKSEHYYKKCWYNIDVSYLHCSQVNSDFFC